MKSTNILFSTLALLALAGGWVIHAQEVAPSKYELEAAFLYNFAKFVEWPPEALPAPATPFTIGVIGENPFDDALERTVKKARAVNGHPFVVKSVKALSELKNCHILFISDSERKRLPEILAALQGNSVLTVSEMDRFLQSGGMVRFVMEGNKVRFGINDEAGKRAGLKISSKLLNLAKRTE